MSGRHCDKSDTGKVHRNVPWVKYISPPNQQHTQLNLSHLQTHFKASTADDLWKQCHDEQFLHLPQRFQLFAVIIPSFIEISKVYANMLSKSSAAGLLYVGKG